VEKGKKVEREIGVDRGMKGVKVVPNIEGGGLSRVAASRGWRPLTSSGLPNSEIGYRMNHS